jgi:hypothetical protein
VTVLPSWENRYHKLWEASKTIDSLEIHLNSGAIFGLIYIDYITTPKQLLGEKADPNM